jgi:tetrapyrrole methylase family protein/MazG family protein
MDEKNSFSDLVETMARLRGEDGCPWDREQTPETLKQYILEEAYEVIGAIEQRSWEELPGELGDLLLQIVFQARLAEEAGRFDIGDVTTAIVRKMIRRHPHVFGDGTAESSGAVLENWERIKRREDPERPVTEGIDHRLPALQRAQRVQDKVSRVGFDWERPEGALAKLEEEIGEFRDALASGSSSQVEEELGDVFFALVNVARLTGCHAEETLKKSISKFEDRFRKVEDGLRKKGLSPHEATLDQMETLWQAAKKDKSRT